MNKYKIIFSAIMLSVMIFTQSLFGQSGIVKVHTKNLHVGYADNNPNRCCLSLGNKPGEPYGFWSLETDYNGSLKLYRSLMYGSSLYINHVNENIGIGNNNPSYKLDVNGNIRCTAITQSSDKRLKKDIEPIGNAVDKIIRLNSISYKNRHIPQSVNKILEQFHSDTTDEAKQLAIKCVRDNERKVAEVDTARYFGFIAQELREIYPELVFEDSEGMLSVNYIGLIPVLVEAIKELKAEISKPKEMVRKINDAVLYQNTPNPFTQNTEIQYYIPQNADIAMIIVCDLNGSQLNQYKLSEKGKSHLLISANEYKPGMYLYTLIVDGKEVDTKKMIITK